MASYRGDRTAGGFILADVFSRDRPKTHRNFTPASHFAQMWAALEAVCGTFYLAVLVARLVSLYRR